MPLDDFLEVLVRNHNLEPFGAPSLFSHPLFRGAEQLIAGLDKRAEFTASVEHDEERMRQFPQTLKGYRELEATLPGQQLPFKPDNRLIIPYKSKLGELVLHVGLLPFTNLMWKDSQERLAAVFAVAGKLVTMRSPVRTAYALQTNSSALYVEGGVITSFSFFRRPVQDIVAMQYFVPPEMDIPLVNPPYRRFNENLAYPRSVEDIELINREYFGKARNMDADYNLVQQMRADLRLNAQLVMLLVSAHQELKHARQ